MTDTAITTIFAAGMAALISLVAGLPVLLVSITNLKQSRKNEQTAEREAEAAAERARVAKEKADEISRKTDEAKEKADTIISKTDEIHTLADGNLTKVTAALATANEKIVGLEKLLIAMSHKKANGGEEA